jgi:hypothetical protein
MEPPAAARTDERPAPPGWERPGRLERLGMAIVAAAAVVVAVLAVVRGNYQNLRKTDLTVYLRAGRAVADGENPYVVPDEHGWHYHYPPPTAILLWPVVGDEDGTGGKGSAYFTVAILVWYALSLAAAWFAVHTIAAALERAGADPTVGPSPAGSVLWWRLRVWPIVVCAISIGSTLVRGQVNLFVAALLAGMTADLIRGRSLRAGLWLSAAIALRIIPAFLLLYALARRDLRMIAGCAVGSVLLLAVFPAAAVGPARTVEMYDGLVGGVLVPGMTGGGDRRRESELMGARTDNHSIGAVAHRILHAGSGERPDRLGTTARVIHWAIGGLLTLALIFAAASAPRSDPIAVVCAVGAFTVLMILISPANHSHYFAMSIILVAGLLAHAWRVHGAPSTGAAWCTITAVFFTAELLSRLVATRPAREFGLLPAGALVLCAAGVRVLWQARAPGRGGAPQGAEPGTVRAL